MKKIREVLGFINNHGLYPDVKIISSPSLPEVIINGKKVLSFCSNNYLGLAASEKLINGAIKTAREYGVGSGGSRLISGNLEIFQKLEQKLAEFKHSESAITFTAGYMANVGTIQAVMNPIEVKPLSFVFRTKNVVLSDELNHASIIDGCRLSKVRVVVYKHCDMEDLEKKLKKYRNWRKLIVTDGIFSMDGDITPLPDIVKLAKKYNALVMIDDAHATGILGKRGSGTAEHFDLDNEVDIKMGTLSKALGASGGYVAGSKELVDYLRVSARSYIFATAMSPIIAGAVLVAIQEAQDNNSLRDKLWRNTERLREGFKKLGYNTLNSQTPIIPVLIGDEEKAIKFAHMLFEKGFFAPCVRWPAVEKNKARIRFTVMSLHNDAQIDNLLDEFYKIAKFLKIG